MFAAGEKIKLKKNIIIKKLFTLSRFKRVQLIKHTPTKPLNQKIINPALI